MSRMKIRYIHRVGRLSLRVSPSCSQRKEGYGNQDTLCNSLIFFPLSVWYSWEIGLAGRLMVSFSRRNCYLWVKEVLPSHSQARPPRNKEQLPFTAWSSNSWSSLHGFSQLAPFSSLVFLCFPPPAPILLIGPHSLNLQLLVLSSQFLNIGHSSPSILFDYLLHSRQLRSISLEGTNLHVCRLDQVSFPCAPSHPDLPL